MIKKTINITIFLTILIIWQLFPQDKNLYLSVPAKKRARRSITRSKITKKPSVIVNPINSKIEKSTPIVADSNQIMLNRLTTKNPLPNEKLDIMSAKSKQIQKKSHPNHISNVIERNNKKLSKEEINNQDILELYMPILEEQGVINNNREKEDNQQRERIIKEEMDKSDKLIQPKLPTNDFSGKIGDSHVNQRTTIPPKIKKSASLIRNQKLALYSTNLNNKYQCILEDGRIIKKSFTIADNISLRDFLLANSVLEYQVNNLIRILEKQKGITELYKDQIVILNLRKKPVAFKQHKASEFGDYNLERLVVFFNNGAVIFKIKNGGLLPKIKYHNTREKNFFSITCDNLEDIPCLSSIQFNCSTEEYDFAYQSIKLLLKFFLKAQKSINKIQIIIQEKKSKTQIGKITKRPRAIIIHTDQQRYYSYIYKDFAGNFHLLNEEGQSINIELLDIAKNPPLSGRISSMFGYRVHPVKKRVRHHSGIDIAASSNLPVFTTLSGWVLYAGTDPSYGNMVIICYGNSLCTLYGHLNMCYVTTGDYVESGRLIGAIGSTGRSTGNHLHYEIFKSNYPKYTVCPNEISTFFASRKFLDPALRYKLSLGLRTYDLPYFYNMKNNISKCINDV